MSTDPGTEAAQEINSLIDKTLDEAEEILRRLPIRQKQPSLNTAMQSKSTKIAVSRQASAPNGAVKDTREELVQQSDTSEHRLTIERHKTKEPSVLSK